MGYTDEELLKARKQMEQREQERHSDAVVEQELQQSIYQDEVTIFHIPVPFTDMEILEGKAVMRLPKDFTPRSEEEIARVFFLGNKPQYVYSNSYLDFVLALNWTIHEIPDEGVFEFAKYVKYMIERVGPRTQFLTEEKLKREEGNLVILKMVANALDGVNYMTMFFTSLEDRILLGSIAFDQRLSKRLAPLADEIVKSLRIIPAEQEG